MRCWIAVVVAACLVTTYALERGAHAGIDDDLRALLDGVERISSPGVPGPLVVFGAEAFPVVAPGEPGSVVVAARWGQGRVVAFGHGGFRGEPRFDTPRLLANAGLWASRLADDGQPLLIWGASPVMIEALEETGAAFEVVQGPWRTMLGQIDLLVIDTHQLGNDEDQQAVRTFVREGGGLLTSGLAWGWLQLNPGKVVQDHPGNRLLREAGLAFADGTLRKDADDGYAVDEPSRTAHALWAFDDLESGDAQHPGAAAATIAQALRTLGASDNPLRTRLDDLLIEGEQELDQAYRNMHERGLTWERDAFARLGIEVYMLEAFDAPPEQIRKHPSAGAFPGALPPGTAREQRNRTVDTTLPGWRSTGLFVPAGELVTLRFDHDWSGSGLVAQIGSHLDPASRGPLHRLPRVVRRFDIDATEIKIANAVGGLLYLDVPTDFDAASVYLEAQGVVLAPHFVLGQTTAEEWRTLRNAPGPWAELESREIALTLPSDVVRDLDDPQGLMEFWDEVVQAQGSLEPRKPTGMPDRQARFVPDVQVSWGYMYAPANRPLTVPVHSAVNMVNLEGLRTNTGGNIWGFFHELGHWHQNPMWTFNGTGEVTVNLFTLYALDAVCGVPPHLARGFTSEKLLADMQTHARRGAPFDRWKREPFMALTMYVQLQQAFGWELYREVFAEYRALPESQRPRNDDEKRDQWMVRVSRNINHNLGPFFEAWGVPTSKQARESISELSVWMPPGWEEP